MSTVASVVSAKDAADESGSTSIHPNTVQRVRAIRLGFSLDWWSVIVAIVLGALIWTGVLPAIGW